MSNTRSTQVCLLATLVTLGQMSVAAAQTTRIVTTNADSGLGSLRQTVADAAPGDTIGFDMSLVVTPIVLSSGQVVLDRNVTIQGPGAGVLTVRSTAALGPNSRVFRVDVGVTATIAGLTISGGSVDASGRGGGIQNLGTLTLSQATVTGNSALGLGGGISHDGAVLTVASSTVSGNSVATSYGGGIYIGSSTLTTTVSNSTLSGNTATPTGAGIFHNGGSLAVINSTLSGNGLYSAASVTLRNTIIANSGGADCRASAATVDAEYSLIEDGLDCVNGTNVNNGTGDPQLGPLQDNGGPTWTHALLPGSPAIDAASDVLAEDAGGTPLATDQRDARRFGGTAVDIGSFEYHLPPTFTPAAPLTLQRGSLGGQRESVGTALQGGAPVVSGGQVAGGTWTGSPFTNGVTGVNQLFVTVPQVSCWQPSGTVRFRVIDDNGAVADGDLQANVVPSTTGACDCPAGSYDDGTACVQASPGFFVNLVGQLVQTACSAGRYQPLAGQTSCLLADPGNYVPFDASTTQTPCRLGTYQPNAGATSCIDSSPGSYVNVTGATEPTSCGPGTYQPNSRQTSCLPAEPGTFVPAPGAEAATACGLGTYQPNAGATSCLLASPGSFVNFLAAIAPVPCDVGKYQPNLGASSCLLADPGFYVPSPGASAQLQCPAGTTSAAGASACTLVAFIFTGFFQPVDNLPTLNVVTAGRSIPVKFGLGGNQGLNIFAAGFPTSTATTCGTTASDDVEETLSTGASTLSYDATSDRYTYTWKTDKAWANTCRTLTLRFTDGTLRQVNFKFKK